ncbi:hypothetical protein C8034_v001693 [Colletotrichum sidae]|uniref:Uncharacterized protein n=1 Tax=Colletotrichum sidae TaxID=1347389 RepID=A0A4R8TPP3_9PEZI|nr:hypothetical protein C8034_v001693 [Colletotrichum sidae]
MLIFLLHRLFQTLSFKKNTTLLKKHLTKETTPTMSCSGLNVTSPHQKQTRQRRVKGDVHQHQRLAKTMSEKIG